MANELKSSFANLSSKLMDLHRTLLMLEAKTMETEAGRPMTPYELLHASLHDPKLSWLRAISQMIVNIDTIVDESPNLSATEASQVASSVSALLENQTGNQDFWVGYTKYLQNPDIIMKHAQLKSILSSFSPKM